MLADSELICTFGDCCEPIPEYLERMWVWYLKGYFAMGLVVYKKNNKLLLSGGMFKDTSTIKQAQELIGKDWDLQSVIRDSRWYYVDRHQSQNGVNIPKGFHSGQCFHGYASVSLEAILKINGFDENHDGDKCGGDLATGIQLVDAGYTGKVLLDKNIWIFENAHENVPKSILFCDGPAIRSNLGLLMLNHEKKRYISNSYILTDEEIDWIYNYSKKDWGGYDMRQNPHFQWWRKHQPIFDLAELRKQVQENLKKGIVEIPEYYRGD